jgi:hypothetical protein
VPRGGQGPTWYGLPVGEIEGLDDREFLVWRERFLRWIEIHTPGQSQVAKLARLPPEEFERAWAESKDRHGAHDIERALARFAARTGIQLRRPEFVAGNRRPVVAAIADGSPARRAGLDAGDRILSVEGSPVAEWDELLFLVGAWADGSSLQLEVAGEAAPAPRAIILELPRRG